MEKMDPSFYSLKFMTKLTNVGKLSASVFTPIRGTQ